MSQLHLQVYPPIIDSIRDLLLDNMAKPKEVLIVIDENGEAVEEEIDDTETISLYETMREILIFLTNINHQKLDGAIQKRLDSLVGLPKVDFPFDRLNKLCWALGSISAA